MRVGLEKRTTVMTELGQAEERRAVEFEKQNETRISSGP